MTNLEKKRILVTGATGFIGSHLTRRLVGEGAEVNILTRPGSKTINPLIKDRGNKITVLHADLKEVKELESALAGIEPEIIYHLAAYTNVGRALEHAKECIQTNIQGTANLLSALDNVDYECFIHTGTNEEYGDNEVPFREDMKERPTSPYSVSKCASEMFCQMYHKAYGRPIAILRPFNAYGPWQKCNRIIPEVIVSSLLGENIKMTDGEQTREFNYIDDIVEGIIKASDIKKAIGEIINIGCGEEHSIREVVEKIVGLIGNNNNIMFGALPYRPNEIWRMFCDNSKAKEILKWEPKYTLDEGLRKTIEWYRMEYERNPGLIYYLNGKF
jgi:UDP-glucose 4-epimerase